MTRHYAGKSCEVDHIYIKKNIRGRVWVNANGIYSSICESKGCETMELNTYVQNFGSHKFYMNLGYIIRGYHFLKKAVDILVYN